MLLLVAGEGAVGTCVVSLCCVCLKSWEKLVQGCSEEAVVSACSSPPRPCWSQAAALRMLKWAPGFALLLLLRFLRGAEAWLPLPRPTLVRTALAPAWHPPDPQRYRPPRATVFPIGASPVLTEVDDEEVVVVRCPESLRIIECFVDWVRPLPVLLCLGCRPPSCAKLTVP